MCRKRMREIVDVTEADMSESSDEDDDDGGEQAAAGGAAAAEAAEAAEAIEVDHDDAGSSYDDSTESLYGWEDENGEQLEDEEVDGESGEDDGQQERWPIGWISEWLGAGLD